MSDESIMFLDSLFSGVDDGWLEITYLTPHDHQWPKTVVDWYALPPSGIDWDGLIDRAERANAAGYGVYYGLGARGTMYPPEQRISKRGRPYWYYPRGKAHDTAVITALWADIDTAGPEGLAALETGQGLPPSVIISSGGGYHGLWLLDHPAPVTDDNRALIIRALKGIALVHKGDPAVADLARIFRLPGFVNTKPSRAGALCTVWDGFSAGGQYDGRYSLETLTDFYAPYVLERSSAATPRRPIDESTTQGRGDLPYRVRQYLEHGAPNGQRNQELLIVAMLTHEAGYSESEVYSLLVDAARAGNTDGKFPDSEISDVIRKACNRTNPKIDNRRARRMAATDAQRPNWWQG